MLNRLQSVDLSKCSLIDSVSTNSSSLAKLSSGMKINSAADDPSGYQISERMEGKLVVGETYFITDGTSNTSTDADNPSDYKGIHSGIRIHNLGDKITNYDNLELGNKTFEYTNSIVFPNSLTNLVFADNNTERGASIKQTIQELTYLTYDTENLENENAIVEVGTEAMFPAFDVEVA